MISTGILIVLLIVRSIAVAASGPDERNVLPIVSRLIGPVGLAFIALLVLRILDLWISNG